MRAQKFVLRLTICVLLLAAPASADRDFPATIIKVKDGDTVRACIDLGFGVFLEKDVRLSGIDAPELHGKKHPTDGSAERATKRLAELVEGRSVIVRTSNRETDKYGRILGEILLPDGSCVNDAMLAEGFVNRYR